MQDAMTVMAGRDELETAADGRREADLPARTDAGGDDAIAEAARTDPSAFQALYERHWRCVFRYLRARTASDEDAADLAATTFERALAGVRGYRPGPSGVRAWLLTIARNAAIDASRRRRVSQPIEAIEGSGIAESGPRPFGRRHGSRLIRSLRVRAGT